jgi:hypothetical protein
MHHQLEAPPNLLASNDVLVASREDDEIATDMTVPEYTITNEGAHQVWVQTELVKEAEEKQLLSEEGGQILKRMVLRQLLAAHDVTLKFLHRAQCEDNPVEAARLANAGSRAFSVFQQGVLALNTLQGNDQRVTLQQVNVSGGNTVVAANLKTGRSLRAEEN